MATSERRQKLLQEKRQRKKNEMGKPGAESNYAKKRAFLNKHGGFGFQWPDKPWKTGVHNA